MMNDNIRQHYRFLKRRRISLRRFQCLCSLTKEDFSFPTVHKCSSTRSIDFPPLWRKSPCTDSCHEAEEDHSTLVEDCNQRKSFACAEGVDDDQIIVGTRGHDQDDKMDMLWEDFNEELYPARSTTLEYNYVSGDMLQLGCVRLAAFNLSKSNAATPGSAITNTGMVLIVRVLKRLFFLHNSPIHHHNLNKPAKR